MQQKYAIGLGLLLLVLGGGYYYSTTQTEEPVAEAVKDDEDITRNKQKPMRQIGYVQ